MSGVYTKKKVEDELDTSEGALPFDLQQVAEDELGETPQRRKESLTLLVRLLSEDKELNGRKDAEFLQRFLRVRKYNVEAALRTVQNYYRIRITSGPVFQEFLPSTVSSVTRNLMMVLPGKDVHGRRVFLFKIGHWAVEESSFLEMHRGVMLCMEHLAKDPTTQVLGMAILLDFRGFTPEKILAMNFGLIRRGLEYLQDCMPMRLKAVPTVNQGTAFDIFFTLIKPFMKTKLVERFHLYGQKFDELHKEIPASLLPEEYGGQAPSADFEGFWSHLETKADEYREDSAYGYVREHDRGFATDAEIEEELTFL